MRMVVIESHALEVWPSTGIRARLISPALVVSWAEGVVYVHALYGRTVAPGSRFVAAHRVLGRTTVLVHTVEQTDRGRSWGTRAALNKTAIVVRLTLRPPPEPVVTLRVDLEMLGPVRAAAPLVRWSLRRSARQAVRRLTSELKAAAIASATSHVTAHV